MWVETVWGGARVGRTFLSDAFDFDLANVATVVGKSVLA